MDIGPDRNNAYSSPIFALPSKDADSVFNVLAPVSRHAQRSCRWSCRLPPISGISRRISTPLSRSTSAGPSPDSCRICGLPMAPADRITSLPQRAVTRWPSFSYSTPTARPSSISSRRVCAWVSTFNVSVVAVRKNAWAVFIRQPRRWFTLKYPTPSLLPVLKSSVIGRPHMAAASIQWSSTSQCRRWFSTRHSPPVLCRAEAPST